MSDAAQPERITCATYTHARRHPMVMGKIGDWTPPVQLTLPQVGVFLLVLFLQVQTWRFWGDSLPRAMGIIVFIGLPVACASVVRRARWEGRSLPRAVVGWVGLWTGSLRPVASGRPYAMARPRALHGARVYVEAGQVRVPRRSAAGGRSSPQRPSARGTHR